VVNYFPRTKGVDVNNIDFFPKFFYCNFQVFRVILRTHIFFFWIFEPLFFGKLRKFWRLRKIFLFADFRQKKLDLENIFICQSLKKNFRHFTRIFKRKYDEIHIILKRRNLEICENSSFLNYWWNFLLEFRNNWIVTTSYTY